MNPKTMLLDVDFQLQEALKSLRPQQRQFVELMADGAKTRAEAAREAGYTGRNPGWQVCKRPRVKHALELLSRQQQLEHGVKLTWKRRKLMGLIEATSDPEAEAFNPNAANQCIRTLAEIDGDIRQTGSGGTGSVTILINSGIPRERVIEHESE